MPDNNIPKPVHIHKYIRTVLGGRRVVIRDGKRYIEKCGGYEVYKCAKPSCTHWIPSEMIEGRKSICWNCNQEMIINKISSRLAKPVHDECRARRVIRAS